MGALFLLLLGLVYFYLESRKRDRSDRIIRTGRKNGRNRLWHFYILFTELPVLNKYFEKVRNRLRTVYPADEISINMKATRIFLMAVVSCIGIIVGSVYIADGDIFFILAGVTMTYIMFMTVIDKSVERIEIRILDQLSMFLDSVREQYNRIGRVDDAVSYTIDSLPYEISLHITKIHKVLTSTHIEDAANEYVDMAPNKYLMTFCAIAATTMEYGDKKLDNGESLFLKNLNFLKEEVNIELLKQRKNNSLFSGLTMVTLLPILAIKPIEMWATSNMPEIAEFYKGSYGIIAMAVVFLLSAASYTIVTSLKNGRKEQEKDTNLFKDISEIPVVARFLNGQVTRNYSKALRHNEMLRMTGDRLGINTFLVKRYFTGILALGAAALILTSSLIQDKQRQLHDFQESFDSSVIQDVEYRETMQAVSEDFAISLEKTGADVDDPNYKRELINEILENSAVDKEDYAEMIATTVIERVQKYKTIYFRWYYLFAIFAAGLIGYMVPLWVLMFRLRSVKMNMEDEVSQFQTLVLLLMHVDGVNTIMLLEWMERFAYVFKDKISQCIIDLPHQGQYALHKLQESETFQPFQSLTNCLLAIDSVGIEKAFANIETDREYYKNKRQEDNEILIAKKANLGKWVAIFPLFFVFGAYLIYPMVALAMNMMAAINQAI